MTKTQEEWVAWARERRACFQTEALVEMVKGERTQVGFSLSLYVAAPTDEKPGDGRREAIYQLWSELEQLAQDVAPEERRIARVQVEQKPRAVLRPENEFKPEVGITLHVFPRGAMAPITPEDRERLAAVEKRLQAFGLKSGRA